MRILSILRDRLSPHLAAIHTKRLESLFFVLAALICGGRLSLTRLGRSCAPRTAAKHNIKLVDRLLGNKKLHCEQIDIYRGIAHILLKGIAQPILLVDWTKTPTGFWALVAAIPINGRSIPIYSEVHHARLCGNRYVQHRFLRALKSKIIPKECVPIVVTDAGFKNPWFAEVRRMHWHFLGRLSPGVKIHPAVSELAKRAPAAEWVASESFPTPTRPRDMGDMTVGRENSLVARLVTYKAKPKKRTSKAPKPATGPARKAVRQAKRPCVLATSLQEYDAGQLVALFRTRMRIEESFRDAKNHRFGWCLRDARSHCRKRTSVLLLLACLGMLAMNLLGYVAEARRLHLGLQSNTMRIRRTLSLFYLACLVIQSGALTDLLDVEVDEAIGRVRSSADAA